MSEHDRQRDHRPVWVFNDNGGYPHDYHSSGPPPVADGGLIIAWVTILALATSRLAETAGHVYPATTAAGFGGGAAALVLAVVLLGVGGVWAWAFQSEPACSALACFSSAEAASVPTHSFGTPNEWPAH